MPEHVDTALRVLQFLLWVAVGLYTWVSNRDRATKEQLDALEAQVHGLKVEMVRLEERVRHLPSERAFAALANQVGEMVGQMRGLRDIVESVGRQYERVDDYLKGQP
jgi:hypothetical protein